MSERIKTMLIALTGGLFSAIVVLGVSAIADNNPGTDNVPKLIPYNGTLEKDGHVINDAVKLHFRIFDGKDAQNPVWEEQLTVQVYHGRFTALLGSSSPESSANLAKVINNADDLYLGIGVVTSSGEVQLSNRQRFLPVPYALWTTASTDFKVGHDLTVSHNISAGGDASVGGALSVAGNTTLEDDLTINGTDLVFSPTQDRGNGGRALVHHFDDTLVINFGKDFSGGIRMEGNVKMEGDVKMEGTVTTSQPLIMMEHYDIGTDIDYRTSFETNYWNCFIGGVIFDMGDIDEFYHDALIGYFYTYPGDDGYWHVMIDFKSHSDHHEAHKFGLVCVRTGISSRLSWFTHWN